MRVLVVEDHPKLAMAVGTVLRREGMAVDVVFDGEEALAHLAATAYEVVVLDRDLPGVHGDDVCRAVVAEGSETRVLMLTASGAVEDLVEGLGLGADDYLAKPFQVAELVARVRALSRRSRPALPPTLVRGELQLDPAHRTVTRSGQPVALSDKEFGVLEHLLRAQGTVVSSEQLLEGVWDEAANPFTNTVRMTISRLRAKLGDPPIVALAVMVVVSLALGWVVAGRVLRPLRTITATTRQISEDNLHQRLALEGPPDELKDLSDTIDGLLARLDVAFEAQRRFAANVSHELRTPLTVGRTLLEMILGDPDADVESFRAICRDVLETAAQQERLIEALLILARSQRGLERRQPLDLATITADVTHARQAAAIASGLRLDVSVRSAPFSGDTHLVQRLVSNLIDNALHYNHPGGSIHVLVDTQAHQARLEVTNTGPHVPPDQVSRLLEPFQRMTTNRASHHDGLGLGLSIVAAIANSHHVTLDAHPRTGGGLDIQITFPAPTPEPEHPDPQTAAVATNRPRGAARQRLHAGSERNRTTDEITRPAIDTLGHRSAHSDDTASYQREHSFPQLRQD